MQIETAELASGTMTDHASTAINAGKRDFRSFANAVSKGFPTIREFEKEHAKK
jgi:hypothetical protein